MSHLDAPVPLIPNRSHALSLVLTVLLAVLLGLVPGTSAQQGSAATDLAAPHALYDTTDDASWGDSTNWATAAPLSAWFGVTTDGDRPVSRLDLKESGLNGPLPAGLENPAASNPCNSTAATRRRGLSLLGYASCLAWGLCRYKTPRCA